MFPAQFPWHSSVLQLLGPSCFVPRADSVARGGELDVEVPLCTSNSCPKTQLECLLRDVFPTLLSFFKVVHILPLSKSHHGTPPIMSLWF